MSRGRNHKIARLQTDKAGAWLATAVALCIGGAQTACRRPSVQGPLAPQLRGPVKDLSAIRAGNEISLAWTVPKRGTGKLTVDGSLKVQVCRRESTSSDCADAGAPMLLARGATGSFSEKLPAALATGVPRLLYYSVELMTRDDRSTGLSNSVVTLAGASPPVLGLAAEIAPEGVLLRWKPEIALSGAGAAEVRLCRREVILTSASEAMRGG
jgi:hypothetical protein